MALLTNINGKFVVEQTTGYVGVGTTDPSYLLHMSSADTTNGTRLIIENTNASGKEYGLIADNTGVFSLRDLTAGADRLTIDSSGNSTFAGNVNFNGPSTKFNTDGDSFFEILDAGTNACYLRAGSGDEIYIGANNNYQLRLKTNKDVVMDNGGSLGIGTDSPDDKLDVENGNIRLRSNSDGNTGVLRLFDAAGTESGQIYPAAGDLRFYTPNDIIMSPVGNVGIGTTSPDTKLHIYGSSTVSEMYLGEDAAIDKAGILKYNQGDGTGTGSVQLGNYGDNLNTTGVTIKKGGNVGIGTSSPASSYGFSKTLEIQGAANAEINISQSNNSKDWSLGIVNGANYQQTTSGQDYVWFIGGSEKFRIRNTGSLFGSHESVAGIVTGLQLMNPVNAAGTGHGTSILLHCTNGDPNRGVKIASSSTSNYAIDNDMLFYTSAGSTLTEKMRIRSGGGVNIGSTGNFSAGKLVVQQSGGENGGIVTLQNGGTYGYYTRVCHNATGVSQAGYWHIKTNIPVGNNIMFMAKFYGYIYGSAQVLDLTHVGYAYSGTNTVINQGVQNNGNNVNSSSAIYTSANGGKVTFRIAFGAGATFSTYFAGVYMDMAFPSPAGQGHDFLIEAQSFSQSTTVY